LSADSNDPPRSVSVVAQARAQSRDPQIDTARQTFSKRIADHFKKSLAGKHLPGMSGKGQKQR
jgi:hypothetical protein